MIPETINTAEDIPRGASICIYGAGEIGISLYLTLQEERSDVNILCFIDTFKQGEKYEKKIVSPEHLATIDFDFIIIASIVYQSSMREILENLNIYNYYLLNPIFNSHMVRSKYAPDKSSCKDVLYAFYDRSVSADGFDILNFLVFAERERIKKGCKYLHLVFVPLPDDHFKRQDEKITYQKEIVNTVTRGKKDSSWRERNIMLPCCWMLPSCQQMTVCTSRDEAALIYNNISQNIFPADYSVAYPTSLNALFYAYGTIDEREELPTLCATEKAKDYVNMWIAEYVPEKKKIIAITLRESPFHNDRNSNIQEWIKFAKSLDKDLYCPVFIRDTSAALLKPDPQLTEFLIFQECSWHMELRMALYELSHINLFTAGGPAVMAFANKKTRLIIFHILRQGVFECSEEHAVADGLIVGKDYFGATPYQRNIWDGENFNIIAREFYNLEKIIAAHGKEGSNSVNT